MAKWTIKDMPSQRGRSAVVTGTGGLGFETSLALARSGARVIIAGRNPAKGAHAVARIKEQVPAAAVRFGGVDLASLASVSRFAAQLHEQQESLDLLVNNAAVMAPPERSQTADGFELQFGTNYLGHFALTAQLLPLLRKSGSARVVTLSSIAARGGTINFDDLQAERSYDPFPVYAQSKLACLMFAIELGRRAEAAGWTLQSLAAHPGVSRTDLIPNSAPAGSMSARVRRYLPFLFQPAWRGALPTLFATTASGVSNGRYYGPDGIAGLRGYPTEERPPAKALEKAALARLWSESEQLTNVRFG